MQHLLRNKIILIGLFLLAFASTKAQKGEIYRPDNDYQSYWLGINFGAIQSHFNYDLGKNFIQAYVPKGQVYNINYNSNLYAGLGLYARTRLKNKILFRTEMNMLVGDKKIMDFGVAGDTNRYTLSIGSAILNLPADLVFESDRYDAFNRRDFMRHYVFGGAKIDIDFTNSAIKVSHGTTSVTKKSNFNAIDLGYEVGMGLSFFLKYATISPEVKFSSSILDIRSANPSYQILQSLDKLRPNYVSFTLHIEN